MRFRVRLTEQHNVVRGGETTELARGTVLIVSQSQLLAFSDRMELLGEETELDVGEIVAAIAAAAQSDEVLEDDGKSDPDDEKDREPLRLVSTSPVDLVPEEPGTGEPLTPPSDPPADETVTEEALTTATEDEATSTEPNTGDGTVAEQTDDTTPPSDPPADENTGTSAAAGRSRRSRGN